jgi:hypothetical protein
MIAAVTHPCGSAILLAESDTAQGPMNASACFERLSAARALGLGTMLTTLAACGGGGTDDPVAPDTFTVGGSITGLNGTVVLQINGGNAVTRSANGAFSFSARLITGTSYHVAVQTQPSGQTCTITNGSGTAKATVKNVKVTCTSNTPSIGRIASNLKDTGLAGTLDFAVSCDPSGATITLADGSLFVVDTGTITGQQTTAHDFVVSVGTGYVVCHPIPTDLSPR